MIVDRLIRPCVGHWITGHGVIFAVELARPFVMRGLAVGADAVHGDFHAVANGRDGDGGVLPNSRADLGLGIVQLPGAHVHVGGEAHHNRSEQRCQSQQDRLNFHVISSHEIFS